jgi:sugar lactone lactonase YvrE
MNEDFQLTVLCSCLSVLLGVFGAGCGTSHSGSGQISSAQVQLLWVADTKNNRMLGYQAPPTNGEPAVVVIGQPAFGLTACNSPVLSGATLCGPIGAALDAGGNLWVADAANNRVVEFTSPFRFGQQAALVIGQPSFAASGPCTPSPTSICGPRYLAFDDQGDLWVSDANGNRVLEFQHPFKIGMPATLVLGQSSFTTSVCNAPPTTVGMCSPAGLAFDSKGNLFVSDVNNARVMMFSPPFSIGMPAKLAIGQLNLLTNRQSPPSQSTLSSPVGLALDGSDNLYVADSGNSRIVVFPTPSASGEKASAVLGNNVFTMINPDACGPPPGGGGTAIDGGTICHPLDVKVDGSGNVVVADQNNRTLIFGPPITTGEFASVVLGQPSLSLQLPPTGLATSQNDPGGVALSGKIITP